MSDANTSELTIKKSRGIALLLVLLFGPFGLLYSSFVGGVLMIIASFIIFPFMPIYGYFFFIIPTCIVWALFFPGKTRGKIIPA